MERIDKINYYLDIAEVVSSRGTCLRRNYGAIIVKDDEIISVSFDVSVEKKPTTTNIIAIAINGLLSFICCVFRLF